MAKRFTLTGLIMILAAAGYLPRLRQEAGSAAPTILSPLSTAPADPAIEVSLDFSPIRTAIHLFYRHVGMGQVRIENRGSRELSGLRLSVRLPGREELLPEGLIAEVPPIAPSGSASVKVFPRFSPAILDERTSELHFRVEVFSGSRKLAERDALVPSIERSGVTWDVPERVAALVDAEQVSPLLRGSLPSCDGEDEIASRNLRLSADVFDALLDWGFRYLEDVPSPAAQALLGVPVDRVSPPEDTLRDHAGDCDDLSVLLAASLEAVGIPAALGVSEGHVFALLDAGLDAEALGRSALDREGLYERGGRAWIPLEATLLARAGSTLLSAWSAARPRLPGLRSGEIRFVEVRKAWAEFPAIRRAADRPGAAVAGPRRAGLPGQGGQSRAEISRLLRESLSRKVEGSLSAAGGADETDADRRKAAALAEAGLRSEAEALLRKALARRPGPEVRIELASAILAGPREASGLADARRQLETALQELDPLDLLARDEALRKLEQVSSLEGKAAAKELAAAGTGSGSEKDDLSFLRKALLAGGGL